MTVQKMLNSLPLVERVMELKLPIKKAYSVYSLAKQINEKRDFFINEEKKLIEKFSAEVTEDGMINFKTVEERIQFQTEHAEFLNYEVEGLAAIELSFDDVGEAEFTPMEIMTLEGVINFVE